MQSSTIVSKGAVFTEVRETPRGFAERWLGYVEINVTKPDILDDDRQELVSFFQQARDFFDVSTTESDFRLVSDSCREINEQVLGARRRYWEEQNIDFEEVLRANRMIATGFTINGERPTLRRMLRYFSQQAEEATAPTPTRRTHADSQRRARQLVRSQAGPRKGSSNASNPTPSGKGKKRKKGR